MFNKKIEEIKDIIKKYSYEIGISATILAGIVLCSKISYKFGFNKGYSSGKEYGVILGLLEGINK